MKKTALLLIVLTFISKIIGLGREITLSYFYGASGISDAYLIALIIPTVISTFVGSTISTGFIPMYNKIEYELNENEANYYTNNLINLLVILSGILIILGFLFTQQLVKIFASGFEGETLSLAIKFTRFSLIGLLFMSITHVLRSYLQLKGQFAIPALVGLPMNIVIILTIMISSRGNNQVLGFGLALSILSQLIFLIPSVIKNKFRYSPIFDIKDKYIHEMFYLALPVLLGVAVNDLNKIVDKTIASNIIQGGVSALSYAINLNNFVQGTFVLSVAAAMYPQISKMAIEKNTEGLKETIIESIDFIILFLIPATLGIMIFSQPIIKLLYGRGAFGNDAIKMTAQVLLYYSVGMLGQGIREILTRPFYALHDTKTPVINASIGIALNIVLNLILSRYLGIGGLALASSISAYITAILMYLSLKKKIGKLRLYNTLIVKVSISAIIMSVASYVIFGFLQSRVNSNFSLLISVLCGSIIYFSLLYYFKVEIINRARTRVIGRLFK